MEAAEGAAPGNPASPFAAGAAGGGWAGRLIAAAATVACLLPFAGKALHVDDPFYVWVARHVQERPLDFFGLTVNWDGSEQPLAAVNKNPPLVSFYTAAAAALVGWSEVGLHLAFLLPALGVTLATFGLARRLGAPPLLASLTCLACPVFLVSATTLMSDVPMLALFCLSLLCFVRGLDEARPLWLAAAGGLAAACALTKYFGISLVPLLLAYGLLRERRLGAWALPLLLPVAALLGYELYTSQAYGAALFARAAGYALGTRPDAVGPLARILVSAVFAGGVLIPVLFLAPLALSRRAGLAAAGLGVVLLGACLGRGRLGAMPLSGPTGPDWNLLAHVAVFGAAGGTLFVVVAADLARRRDAAGLLLAFWTLGTFVFAAAVNYTTNGRALLPLAPAVAILIGRGVEVRAAERSVAAPRAAALALLAPGLAIALLAARGDTALADASRAAARAIAVEWGSPGRVVWFEGQWGFQHYMQQAGGRPVDVRRSVLRPGDVLASPANTRSRLRVSPRAATRVDTLEIPAATVTTMALGTGTGFYAIQWGPLPYRLRPGYAERFEVRRVEHLLLFESDPQEIERRRLALRRALGPLAVLLALDARGWRDLAPEQAGPCLPVFERLAAGIARGCRWCSTPAECETCRDAVAARLAADPDCATRLAAAARAGAARCGPQRQTLLARVPLACPDCRGQGDCEACLRRLAERAGVEALCVEALKHEVSLAGGELP